MKTTFEKWPTQRGPNGFSQVKRNPNGKGSVSFSHPAVESKFTAIKEKDDASRAVPKPNWYDHAFEPWKNPQERTDEAAWDEIRRMNAEYIERNPEPHSGVEARPRILVGPTTDWLDPEVPTEWLTDLLYLIRTCPHLEFLLRTKTPEGFEIRIQMVMSWLENKPESETNIPGHHLLLGRLLKWLPRLQVEAIPPHNIRIGITVKSQESAYEQLFDLLNIPAVGRWVFVDQPKEEVNLMDYLDPIDGGYVGKSLIEFAVCNAPIQDLADQCEECGVPFHLVPAA